MSFLQMSNYPMTELGFGDLLRDPYDRLYDQHFGETLTANDVIVKKKYGQGETGEYGRHWRPQQFNDSTSTITTERNKFEVKLDVERFGRDDVQVKIADGHIVVEAKHEEKQDDHGYVSRQFVRRYLIPTDLAADEFESRLSADGVLTVIARRKGAVDDKIIPVMYTGRKDNEQPSTSQEKKEDSRDQASSSQEKKVDPKDQGSSSQEKRVEPKDQSSSSQEKKVEPKDQGSSSREKKVDPKDQSSSSQEKKVEPKDQGSSSQEQKEDPKKESKKDSQLRKMLK